MAVQVMVTTPSERRMDWSTGRETTVTTNDFESLKLGEPLSVTFTAMLSAGSIKASVGVQLNTPLVGFTLAPAGAPGSRLKVRVSPLGSVAVLVKMRVAPSLTVLLEIAVSEGGLLVAPPVMVKRPEALVAL